MSPGKPMPESESTTQSADVLESILRPHREASRRSISVHLYGRHVRMGETMFRIWIAGCLLSLAVPLAGASSRALAQDCIRYEDHTHLVGRLNFSGRPVDVAVSGTVAVIADNYAGVRFVDISNPREPRLLSTLFVPDEPWKVITDGSTAYVGCETAGLQIIDFSDPTNPSIIGAVDTALYARGCALRSHYIYVADASDIAVIDVADRTHPVLVNSVPVQGRAMAVAMQGNLLFLAAEHGGLQLFDVSIPESPVLVGQVQTPTLAESVAVAGDYAYVGGLGSDAQAAFAVVRITDPANPEIVGSLLTNCILDVEVIGSQALLAAIDFRVVDVSTPSAPTIVGSVGMVDTAYGVAVQNGFAYVADYGGLGIVELTPLPPASPVAQLLVPGEVWATAVEGNLAVTVGSNDLRVISLADPFHPVEVGSTGIRWTGYGVAVHGARAFMTSEGGLREFSLADPAVPLYVGGISFPSYSFDVKLSGDYAYVANASNGLRIVNVVAPGAPQVVCTVTPPLDPRGIDLVGDMALVANGNNGLAVIDISDPAQAQLLGQVDTPGYALSVAAVSPYAYVAAELAGIQIVRFDDPRAPVLVGELSVSDAVRAVAVKDGVLYAAAGQSGLLMFDVTRPESPILMGSVDVPSEAQSVTVSPGAICLGAGPHGIVVARPQCSNPVAVFLSNFDVEPRGTQLDIRWEVSGGAGDARFRLSADYEGRTAPVPYTQDAAGRFRAEWTRPEAGRSAEVGFSLWLISANGPEVLLARESHDAPISPSRLLLTAAPTPFNPRTTLSFALPLSGRVTLALYDARGVRRRTLVSGDLPAGEHRAEWDGRSDGGAPMPSGTYFARLETSSGVRTVKVALAR
jgi:hypothetical protein